MSENCVDIFNPKVVQATMGSLSRVEIHKVELEDVLKKIKKKNITCYGACLSGKNIYTLKKERQYAFVFGNESQNCL